MSELPRYIADLCGVMDDTEVMVGWGRSEMRNPVQMIKHKDGCWALSFQGQEVGWINPISVRNKHEHRYRALSIHGSLRHTLSLSEARSFLMEEYC